MSASKIPSGAAFLADVERLAAERLAKLKDAREGRDYVHCPVCGALAPIDFVHTGPGSIRCEGLLQSK